MKSTSHILGALQVFLIIIVASVTFVSYAKDVEIYISPIIASTTLEKLEEFTSLLRETLNRRNVEKFNLIWTNKAVSSLCGQKSNCISVMITELKESYLIKVSSINHAPLTSTITPPANAPHVDVAEALAIKINFLLKMAVTKTYKESDNKTTPKKAPVAATENKLPLSAEKKAAPQKEVQQEKPQEKPKTEEPKPEAAKNNPPPEKEKPKALPVSEKPVVAPPETGSLFHLEINPAFLTGFNRDVNTFGLEVGCVVMVYAPVALRLDVGYHPFGFAEISEDTEHKLEYRYTLLPIEVTAGYRNDFGSWYFGAYGGLLTTKIWFSYQTDKFKNSSEFAIGAITIIEAGYNINKIVSFGTFIKPSYISDNVNIREDNITLFSMPNFLLTTGLSLNVSF